MGFNFSVKFINVENEMNNLVNMLSCGLLLIHGSVRGLVV